MGDDTIRAIDKLFDWVDRSADAADLILNRTKYTEEQHRARVKTRREVIDAKPADPAPAAKKAAVKPSGKPSTSTAVARKKPSFYIMESVVDGHTLYIVTDGGAARTECSTRGFAEEILKALEKSS